MTKITYIPGEIANAAIDEHGNRKPVTRTQHIFDDAKGKSQAEVNEVFGNAIGGLNSQNYVTVDSFNALPATGAADTVYRVSNWDGTQQDPTVYSEYAWNGTQYIFLCVKSQIGEVFDISVYNNNAKYADLAAALNGGANIPQSLQKGGMSVKFVHTYDNKYIQYRLTKDSWSINTDDWAIADEGVYVDNPEFVYVKTDAENKILWAIRTDGDIFYGAGVPSQVVNYINEKIAELSLDEYEDIVAFLDDLEKGDKTLQTLFDEKVDKEEGKSLINAEYAEGVSQIENPEFAEVHTDTNDKILYGVKQNGDFYFGAGIPPQIQAELDEVAEVANNKVDKEEGKSLIDSDYASSQSVIENPDFIDVKTDSEGRILEGITKDGRKEINIPIDTPSSSIESYSNPEWMSVETDSEGKILGGRKKDGTKIENLQSIFNEATGNSLNLGVLNLSDEGLEKLSKELDIQPSDESIHEYPCVRDAAKDGQTGVIKIGSELYASVVDNPSALTHKQDAYINPYYDANSTLKQYTTIGSRIAIPENICNRADQEEIDFTPSEIGKTRIIVGKSSNDVFFVSRVNCDYGEGVPDTTSRENCLETTTDFVAFTPIFRAANSETIQTGLYISGYGAIEIKSVKEFANGDFIVAGTCWYDGGTKTCFFILKSDFSAITPITCTYLDGTTRLMMDEFNNNVYDWHIAISGSKALVTTYGSRQPATDYGRVWYTEDNGVTWKQIFQMTNHYQDGVAPGDPAVTQVHTHGVMIDEYDDKLFVIAGEDNANLFWSDKGWDTTDDDWNVIPIRRELPLQQQTYMQVVNGYAFATNLIFGSDCSGAGAIYRLNKLGKDSYSEIQVAHEFLPNKVPSTMYCGAGMYRRDNHSPLFFCETRENCMPTEEQNEILEQYHKARVVATYDGVNFTEIWTDDTFGTHETYIASEGVTTRKFSYCGRDMNFYLLNNGDAVIKYIGRSYNYFGGTPIYSVQGNTYGCCKVRWIKNVEKYL